MTRLLRVGGVPEHFNLPSQLVVADEAFAGTGVKVRFSDFPAGTGELTRALRDKALPSEGSTPLVAALLEPGHSWRSSASPHRYAANVAHPAELRAHLASSVMSQHLLADNQEPGGLRDRDRFAAASGSNPVHNEAMVSIWQPLRSRIRHTGRSTMNIFRIIALLGGAGPTSMPVDARLGWRSSNPHRSISTRMSTQLN